MALSNYPDNVSHASPDAPWNQGDPVMVECGCCGDGIVLEAGSLDELESAVEYLCAECEPVDNRDEHDPSL